MAKEVVSGSPSNSIATKNAKIVPGFGKHKTGSGAKSKKVGNKQGPYGKKM